MTALPTPDILEGGAEESSVVASRRNHKLLEYIHDRVHVAQPERDKYEPHWDKNLLLTVGAQQRVLAPHTNREYAAADRISGIIGIQWAVQTETPPRPVYQPRETGEPPEWMLKPSGAMKAQQMGLLLDPEQLAGESPIDDATAQQLLSMTQPQVTEAPAEGPEGTEMMPAVEQVPVFDPEQDFIAVTDALCAEAYTQEVHSQWDLIHGDEIMRGNIFDTIAIGHDDLMVQWDARESRIKIVPLYPYNVWVDPWMTHNGTGAFVVIRQVVPLQQAKADHPDIPDEDWEKLAQSPSSINPWGGSSGDRYSQMNDREVVERWTLFERHVLYPREIDDAVDRELVQRIVDQVPVEAVDPVTGIPTVSFEQRESFVLAETGEPTAPGMPNWPQREGIRQVEMLGDIELYDGESDFSDIPVGRNRNILVPKSPYAQGEPQRLAPLQAIYNDLWTRYKEYSKFFAQPQKAMPLSALHQMREDMKGFHATAKTIIGIPDELIDRFDGMANVVHTFDTPQLQQAFVSMMEMIRTEMDTIGGTAGVLRGEAKSDWSGETVNALQSAARGPIGGKARSTSAMLKYLGGIIANLNIDFLSPRVAAKRNKKYPEAVWRVMRNRIKRVGFDVVAEVSGAGTREERQRAMQEAAQANPNFFNSPTFTEDYLSNRGFSNALKIAQESVAAAQAPAIPA